MKPPRALLLAAATAATAGGTATLLRLGTAPHPDEPAAWPAGAGEHYRLGLELARIGQLERAQRELEACLEKAPDHAGARFQRGRMLLARGEATAGLGEIRRALELAPRDGRFHRFLLELFSGDPRLRDPRRAREHLEGLRERDGELIDFDLEVRRELHRTQALEIYGLAARLLRPRKETLSPALRQLYEAFFPGGNEFPGVQGIPGFRAFQWIFRRHPGLTTLKTAVAEQLVNPSRLGLPEVGDDRIPGSTLPLGLAQKALEEVLDFSPWGSDESLDLMAGLAILEMKMGDYRSAASRFEHLLGRGQASAAVVRQNTFYLGLCRYKLGENDEAARLFAQVLEAAPGDELAAWFLHLLGRREFPSREGPLPPDLTRRFRFEDAAPARGVAKVDAGGSSAWGDYDLDGDLDLFVSGCDTYSILYRNEGGRFTDASREAGLEKVASGFSNLFADPDGDGDLDLFICRDGWAGPAPNSLFENRGDGTFTDVTARSGLARGRQGSSFTASFADFDLDGDLDLFVANGVCGDGSTNRLWVNQGGGTFRDGTRAAGLEEPWGTRTIGCAVGDYDLDGRPDIFLSGLEPTPNRLYHNGGGGTFEEVARRAGVEDSARVATGFVAALADLSGDGLPDIFMTKWEPDFTAVLRAGRQGYRPRPQDLRNTCRLFRGRGDGTFEDVSEAAGFIYPHGTMGLGIADLDNDGFQEIYLGNGGPALERLEPDSLYVNLEGKRFVEVGRRVGLGHLGKGHGVSFADLDRDGDLDIYMPLGGAFHGDFWQNALYLNQGEKKGHWLQLDLIATGKNRMAVGAQVTVVAGRLKVYREKKCGVGFGACDSPYLHVGLGAADRASSLEVRWPSGRVDRFEEVAADRFLRLEEGTGKLEEEGSP